MKKVAALASLAAVPLLLAAQPAAAAGYSLDCDFVMTESFSLIGDKPVDFQTFWLFKLDVDPVGRKAVVHYTNSDGTPGLSVWPLEVGTDSLVAFCQDPAPCQRDNLSDRGVVTNTSLTQIDLETGELSRTQRIHWPNSGLLDSAQTFVRRGKCRRLP